MTSIESSSPRTKHRFRKSLLAGIFVLVVLLVRSNVEAESPQSKHEFRAACVKVDITPDTPQWLHGYAPRQSTGVRDHIFHRIAAMDDGTTAFYLVSSDICTISSAFYRDFCTRLEEESGIKPEQVWWATTHSHSAPHVGPQELGTLFFGGALGDRSTTDDTAYWEKVKAGLIAGIKEAREKLEPARFGLGIGEARANINRREVRDGKTVLGENPDGPTDRQLGLIRLERPDGTPIGLIANYAIHGTCLHGGNTLITGDAPGWASSYVEGKLGVPILFLNGAEGNIAPHPTVGNDPGDPHIKSFDETLGEPIVALNNTIKATSGDIKLSLSRILIDTPRKDGLGWLDTLSEFASVGADGKPLVRVPVYTLTINGDTVIWAAPIELFCEIAINIRAASPFKNTLYFGLTNGSLLYMPTRAAFAEGGYEPSVSVFTDQAEADFTAGVTGRLKALGSQ